MMSFLRPRISPTVYIVDDDELMLDSLLELFTPWSLPVRCFTAAQTFLDEVESDATGCLIVDLRMPGMNGLQLLSELGDRGIDLNPVVVTAFADVPSAVEAMKLGAVDFLEKPFSPTLLLDCVQRILEDIRRQPTSRFNAQSARKRLDCLTARERQILDLVISGMSNKQIAGKLALSEKTISAHRTNTRIKMGVASHAELLYLIGQLRLS